MSDANLVESVSFSIKSIHKISSEYFNIIKYIYNAIIFVVTPFDYLPLYIETKITSHKRKICINYKSLYLILLCL